MHPTLALWPALWVLGSRLSVNRLCAIGVQCGHCGMVAKQLRGAASLEPCHQTVARRLDYHGTSPQMIAEWLRGRWVLRNDCGMVAHNQWTMYAPKNDCETIALAKSSSLFGWKWLQNGSRLGQMKPRKDRNWFKRGVRRFGRWWLPAYQPLRLEPLWAFLVGRFFGVVGEIGWNWRKS